MGLATWTLLIFLTLCKPMTYLTLHIPELLVMAVLIGLTFATTYFPNRG